jgi:hypothetical protein
MTVIPAAAPPPAPRPFYQHLYVQVLIAIVAGALLGHFHPTLGAALKPLGDAFIKLVKMVIAPVIFLTLVSGIAGLSELRSAGRIALKAFGYFLFFSTLALVVGLVVANVVQPGAGMNVDPATLDTGAVKDYAAKAHETSLIGFLLAIIPTTLVSALAQDNILQVLLVAILFGVSISLVGEPARPLLDVIERLNLVVFKVVAILMRVAPIGAFGAIAFTVGKYGAGSLVNLGGLVLTFYATSLIFVLGVLGVVARLHGFSILRLIAYLNGAAGAAHQAGGGGVRSRRGRAGGADGLFVQPRRHQHLYDAGGAVHRAGVQRRPHARPAAAAARGGDALVQGRGGGDRRGLHHAGGDAVDRPDRAGRGHGADPRRRPLHERVPQPDQFRRQCGGRDRGGALGEQARPRPARRRARRTRRRARAAATSRVI